MFSDHLGKLYNVIAKKPKVDYFITQLLRLGAQVHSPSFGHSALLHKKGVIYLMSKCQALQIHAFHTVSLNSLKTLLALYCYPLFADDIMEPQKE